MIKVGELKMHPKTWRIRKALLNGAIIGYIWVLLRAYASGQLSIDDGTWANEAGALLPGGALGGAVLFGFITVVRNAWVGRSK